MDTKLPTIKKTNPLFIQIFIIALGLVAGYLIYSQFLGGGAVMIQPPSTGGNDLAKFKDVGSFDFDFLKSDSLKSLKVLGEVPVQPGVTGKQDLFAPF